MHMIIKSSWLPARLYEHELDVLRWIEEKRPKLATDFVPNIPFPVGTVVNELVSDVKEPGTWCTMDGGTHNSTIATFCVPGSHLDGQGSIDPREHLRVYRGLAQTLKYLAELGIHYRDLNNGNVMRTKAGECLLIDFGNARILKHARGSHSRPAADPALISLDDSRSGTLAFQSRRIQKLGGIVARCDSQKELVSKYASLAAQGNLTPEDEIYRNKAIERMKSLSAEIDSIHGLHCYIDDLESSIYLMLFQASRPLIYEAFNVFEHLSPTGRTFETRIYRTRRAVWERGLLERRNRNRVYFPASNMNVLYGALN